MCLRRRRRTRHAGGTGGRHVRAHRRLRLSRRRRSCRCVVLAWLARFAPRPARLAGRAGRAAPRQRQRGCVNVPLVIVALAALAAAVIGYLLGTLRAARRAEHLRAELAEARATISSDEQQRARTAELLAHSEAQMRATIE